MNMCLKKLWMPLAAIYVFPCAAQSRKDICASSVDCFSSILSSPIKTTAWSYGLFAHWPKYRIHKRLMALKSMKFPIKTVWIKYISPCIEFFKQLQKNYRKKISTTYRRCLNAFILVGFISGTIFAFKKLNVERKIHCKKNLHLPEWDLDLIINQSDRIFQEIKYHQDQIDAHWDQVNFDFWKSYYDYSHENSENFEDFRLSISREARTKLMTIFEKFLRMYGFKEQSLHWDLTLVAPEMLQCYLNFFKPFYTFSRIYFFDHLFEGSPIKETSPSKNVRESLLLKCGDRKEIFHCMLGDLFKASFPWIQSMEAELEPIVHRYQTSLDAIKGSLLNAFTHFIELPAEDFRATLSSFNQIFEAFNRFTDQWIPVYFKVWKMNLLVGFPSIKEKKRQSQEIHKQHTIFKLEEWFLLECCEFFFPDQSFSSPLNASRPKILDGPNPSNLKTFEKGFKNFLEKSYCLKFFYPKVSVAIEAYINEIFDKEDFEQCCRMKDRMFKVIGDELTQETIVGQSSWFKSMKQVRVIFKREEVTRENIMEEIEKIFLPGKLNDAVLRTLKLTLQQSTNAEYKEKLLVQIEPFFESVHGTFPTLIKFLEKKFSDHRAIDGSAQKKNHKFQLHVYENYESFQLYIAIKQKFYYVNHFLDASNANKQAAFLKRLDSLILKHLLHQQLMQVQDRCIVDAFIRFSLLENWDYVRSMCCEEEWIESSCKIMQKKMHTAPEEEINRFLQQKILDAFSYLKSEAENKQYFWSKKIVIEMEKEIKKILERQESFEEKRQKIKKVIDDFCEKIPIGTIPFWFRESEAKKKEILEWNSSFASSFSEWKKEFSSKVINWCLICKTEAEKFINEGIGIEEKINQDLLEEEASTLPKQCFV